MTLPKPTTMELDRDQLAELLHRAETALNEEDYATIKALIESYAYLTNLLEDKRTSIERLRKLLFGAPTEKTRDVFGAKPDQPAEGAAPAAASGGAPSTQPPEPSPPPPGHGRHGADTYSGGEKVRVPHASLRPGDRCPECKRGKLYESVPPGVLVRLVGQAPLHAKVYELQKLRCHLCGQVFTAEAPPGVGSAKYDASAAAMIALLKYGSGLPFNRLEGLQGNLAIPLPASTQWDIVGETAQQVEPAYEELIRQAAQGEVLYNDDTTVKILEFMGQRAKHRALAENSSSGPASSPSTPPATAEPESPAPPAEREPPARRGLFTSGIVSTGAGRRVALFFSGPRHAGENLADVLSRRAAELGPPIQMCDALSRNQSAPRDEGGAAQGGPAASRRTDPPPSGDGVSRNSEVAWPIADPPTALRTILANCLAHGRRRFVEVAPRFPEECRYVLERLAEVYRNDALARERKLSPQERLRFHQSESGPIMKQLQEWCVRQFTDRLVEPNSGLGEAISYLLKHWMPLTLFLRRAGAPLDNNICERALKKAILHRKNAMFYKTLNGAHVGDVFMSLIHTCELCGVNPFDYLTELQRHATQLSSNPQQWLPWTYRDELRAET
jgi:transposase